MVFENNNKDYIITNKLLQKREFLAHNITVLVFEYLHSFDACLALSITFANNLDPDQTPQNVSPDLNPNCLTLS